MSAMDGIRYRKALPYYSPYYLPPSAKPSAFAPPFSANGVSAPPSVDSADFQEALDSHNSRYGYASFSEPLGLDSDPFSKLLCGFSHEYSGLQSMDPLSSQMTRDTSPDLPFLDILNTKPHEIEHPCQNPRAWNRSLDFNKGHVNVPDDGGAFDSFFPAWNTDECNPAVYPPCWNGAPAARYPAFGAYEPLHPKLIGKIDELLIASCLEGPKDFHVELAKYGRESCEISTKNKVQDDVGNQEKDFTGLVNKFPVSNCVSQECNSDGAVNDGHTCVGKQVLEENQFMSQNQNSLCRCRYVGFNVSGCLECCFAQQAENGLSSLPSFMAGAPEKAPAGAPAPKLDIQLMVQTMHNMSELLLNHCLIDASQLNGQYRSMLEKVIRNVRSCTLIKDAQQIISAKKSHFPELGTGNLGGQSPQLQQNSLVKEPHTSKAMTSVNSENFREEEESASHSVPYGHGNIWVDVAADEAYSLIYGARLNQMMEVEKHSRKHGDNPLAQREQSKTEADFQLSPDQNSAEEVNSSHSVDPISAMHATANFTEPCGLGLSANPNEPIASENEGEGSQKADEQDEANEEDVSNSGDSGALDMAFEGTDDDSLNAETQDGSDADDDESDLDSDEVPKSSRDADDEESDLELKENEEMQAGYGPRSSSDWELV